MVCDVETGWSAVSNGRRSPSIRNSKSGGVPISLGGVVVIQAVEWRMMIARDQATQEWREIITHRLLALGERLVQILAELKGEEE